jgi:hypothetical protein
VKRGLQSRESPELGDCLVAEGDRKRADPIFSPLQDAKPLFPQIEELKFVLLASGQTAAGMGSAQDSF